MKRPAADTESVEDSLRAAAFGLTLCQGSLIGT
jgi:hypothetical protein